MSSGKLNPVAWMEGMFLRPQHLQQHDLFADARLRHHLLTLDPFHWGVREVAFDEEALAENRIVVTRLDAVLRDGSVVTLPGNARIDDRTFPKGQDRIDVHLALRSWSEQDANLAGEEGQSRLARYRLGRVELPDLTRGGPPASIDVLQPNLRLLLSADANELGLYDSFKLAEIEASDDSKHPYVLAKTYVPPLLAMQASALLMEEITKVTSQVSARVRAASAMAKTVSADTMPRLFMRYTLARMAPLLRHLGSTGATPPFPLYTTFVELAGALGSYSHDDAIELPTYDHENLYLCFKTLIDFISSELDKLAPDNYSKLPMAFEPATQAYVTKGLDMRLVDPRNGFYLAVRAPLEAKELNDLVGHHGKASSAKGVTPLIRFNLPGLALEHLPGAPTEIESMTGYSYFKIDSRGKEWPKVQTDFSFALHLGKLTNANVVLYVATTAGAP